MNSIALPHRHNALLDSLREDKVVGMISVRMTRSIDIALLARTAGFETLYVDMEHSTFSVAEAGQICIACLGVGVTALVRVPSIDEAHVSRMLDAGAMGIIAPHIHNAVQAKRLVDLCRFAPLGQRSSIALLPQLGYRSMAQSKITSIMNQSTAVIAMIEDKQALSNVDEIAAVQGIDILLVGCSDLSASLGIQEPAEAEACLIEAVGAVISACIKHGKVAGIGGLARKPKLLALFVSQGARLVSMGTDVSFLLEGAQRRADIVRTLRQAS